MSKFICPYCYGEHEIENCGIKCTAPDDPQNPMPCSAGNVTRDSNGWIPQIAKRKCINCNGKVARHYYCPNIKADDGELIQEIPFGFIQSCKDNLPIALIGAKASGKSNYIGVLIEVIRRKMVSRFDCSLDIACDAETLQNYENYYYNPLYVQGSVVQATDAGAIPPLVFPIRFYNAKGKNERTATLTFYDTAGENFDSSDDIEVYNQYISNSKGIILLLDPLQVGSIRKRLEGKMPLPKVNTDVAKILSRVVQNIRNVKNVKGTINIPLALVFTKMDALEQFDVLPPDSCLREESEHLNRGSFVLSDFGNTNIAMRDILENWLDDEVVQMMKQFSKQAIFGLSALGNIPNGSQLTGDAIQPKRVLDPLLWILAEHKYIKTVKK